QDYRRQGDIFQLMTPSMLPKLKNLRSKEGVVFIVGTNYCDLIDPAAKRPGRIDYQFLVTPPDSKQRATIIRQHLAKLTKSTLGYNVANKLSESDWADLSKRTALAVFNELVQWLQGVVARLPTTKIDKTTLISHLGEGFGNQPPGTVRLLSYGSRFRWAQA